MQQANPLFTIAHISDLHIPPLPKAGFWQLANKRLLSYLSWHRKRKYEHQQQTLDALRVHLGQVNPDHICITGDLTNITLPAEVDQAQDWLRNLAEESRISVIPGNPDALVPGSLQYALRSWQPWMQDDDGRIGFPFLHRRGPVNIIGISTAVATPPLLSLGWIGKRQLQRTEAMLAEIASEHRPSLLLIHHPPHDRACSPRRGLSDRRKLHQLLQRQPVTAVLFGHLHYPIRAELPGRDGPIPALGTASGSAVGAYKARAHYHLLKFTEVGAGYRLEVEHYEYAPQAQAFKLRDTEVLPVQASVSG
jgi:3',5'-cyclic AMP phosphodiesterase CpdA